jgi:hypothetical protein
MIDKHICSSEGYQYVTVIKDNTSIVFLEKGKEPWPLHIWVMVVD